MGGNRSRMHNGNDSRRYYDWLEHSSQDLIAAKILSEDDRCYRLSAFHCQQAIEKALKAYILLKSDVLVDGHNLTWLCRQAKKYDKGFHQWFDESADLNQCYIETRYPADIERGIPIRWCAIFIGWRAKCISTSLRKSTVNSTCGSAPRRKRPSTVKKKNVFTGAFM